MFRIISHSKIFNKYFKLISIVTVTAIFIIFMAVFVGCREPNPVYYIQLFKQSLMVPPSFGEGIQLQPQNPYPDFIQGEFSPGDSIFLGLVISQEVKRDVYFSKYTYYDKKTNEEFEITTGAGDLGPFEKGQITLVAFNHPWPVPEKSGLYELRVYSGSKVIASALFEVK